MTSNITVLFRQIPQSLTDNNSFNCCFPLFLLEEQQINRKLHKKIIFWNKASMLINKSFKQIQPSAHLQHSPILAFSKVVLIDSLKNTIFFFFSYALHDHNWSATKQRLHPQSVAETSCHSVLSGDRIRHCETSSGSHCKDTDQCL